MNPTKQKILETAARLFETQGFHATGLNQILQESGTPKGSLYHYFPEGKEQIGAETALWSAAQLADRVSRGLALATAPAEAVYQLALGIAQAVERSGFAAGGPLMMLAAESAVSSDRLNAACRQAYALIQAAFAEKLAGNTELAQFVVAALEGAILLSRVQHSGDPLRHAAGHLKHHIQSLEESK